MSKQNTISSKPPKDWVCRESKTHGNKLYYYNTKTGVSSWTNPNDQTFKDKQQVMNSGPATSTNRRARKRRGVPASNDKDCQSTHEAKKTKFIKATSPIENVTQKEKIHQPPQVNPNTSMNTPILTGNAKNQIMSKGKGNAVVGSTTGVLNAHQLKVMEMLKANKNKKNSNKRGRHQNNNEKLKTPLPSSDNVDVNQASTSKVLNIHQKNVLQKIQQKCKNSASIVLPVGIQSENPENFIASPSRNKRSAKRISNPTVNNVTPRWSVPAIAKVWRHKNIDRTPVCGKNKPLKRLNSNSRSCQRNAAEKRLKQLRNRLSLTNTEDAESDTSKQDIPLSGDDNIVSTVKTAKVEENAQPLGVEMSLRKEVESLSKMMESFKDTIKKITGRFDVDSTENKNDSLKHNESNISLEEDMDWETVVAEIQARTDSQPIVTVNRCSNLSKDNNNESKLQVPQERDKTIYVVVDTNVFISHLSTLQMLSSSSVKVINHQHVVIMVPWRVLSELDNLKSHSSAKSPAVGHKARMALRYLHDNLSSNRRVQGQSVKDASSHKFPCILPDDEILNCCLQLADRGENVILLSNDINLCNKAIVNNLKTFTHVAFKELIGNNDASCMETNRTKDSNIKPGIEKTFNPLVIKEDFNKIAVGAIEQLLTNLLSKVLENEMIIHYDHLWRKVVLIEPPWCLPDVLECILKHWIPVFNSVLSDDDKTTLKELQNLYPPKKGKRIYRVINVQRVADLGTTLSSSCQRNTKYAAAGKECAQKISEALRNMNNRLHEKCNTEPSEINASENIILEVFKNIWNGLSIFCGKLASALGVPHILQINIDTPIHLDIIISEADAVNNQLTLLTDAMKSILKSLDEHNPSTEMKEEASRSLYNILVDTVRGMGHNEFTFNEKQILQFCLKNREVIENGSNDFMMLKTLLKDCSVKYKCSHMFAP